MEIKGRVISKGHAKGEALLSREPLSFLGNVNPKTGVVIEKGHPLEGKSVAGKVLIFPRGKGSTVGSYVILEMKQNGVAPCAIINVEAETIIAVGAIISEIPMLDKLEDDVFTLIKDGDVVEVDADKGILKVK